MTAVATVVGSDGNGARPEDNGASARHEPEAPRLEKLRPGQRVDIERLRDAVQRLFLVAIWAPTAVLTLVVVALAIVKPLAVVFLAVCAAVMFVVGWIGWKMVFVHIRGNAIEVGPSQYPQLYRLVADASQILGIDPPTVLVLQGHGLFELLVAKRFSRRGFIIITSNMLDDLTETGSSRELMFFIGRQLGLLASGYFRFWFAKLVLGRFAIFFYQAWERHCHYLADRLGLLVAGDLDAAEQALLIITAGRSVASCTNMEALRAQRAVLFDSPWAYIRLLFSEYPFMIDRILDLREFAYRAAADGVPANAPLAIGALPIEHRPIRALPLLIVHGHDALARLELENFLYRRFPHVVPKAIVSETDGAAMIAEKFERYAAEVHGAVALLTPDDVATALRDGVPTVRARQNVIMEIGWCWGRFGRKKFLLLSRGAVELPSDLKGVDVHPFNASPVECAEALMTFVQDLSVEPGR